MGYVMDHLPAVEQEPKVYRAFILRWWEESSAAESAESQWRFLIEDIHDRQTRWGFKSFPELIQFLQTELIKTPTDETALGVFEPIQQQQHADD
jgi:hypothetical protein